MFFTFIILTIGVVFIQIPSYLCQVDRLYETCSQPFECADNKDISYPFWGGGRPESCGYPGFQLTCEEDQPLLNISSMVYRVLEIDNRTQTLKVARQDLFTTNCPATIQNTTLDFNLFRFSSTSNDGNITLYYGCTINSNPGSSLPNLNQFVCNEGGTNRVGLYMTQESALSLRDTGGFICDSNITVPVNRSMYAALAIPAPVSTLDTALKSGFSIEWSANNSNCERCVDSGGVCGYDHDSALFACHGTRTGNGKSKTKVILATAIPGGAIIVCLLVCLITWQLRKRIKNAYLLSRRAKTEKQKEIENFLKNNYYLAPRRYKYSDLKKITKSFSDKLGKGGYGSVYKGKLQDGSLVAVKILNESKGNGEEFTNEVASISRTSHVNIVTLLGFCFEGSKRALIYEFLPNGSLEKYIPSTHASSTEDLLGWEKLFDIVVGIARGLEYLHQGCNMRILHFDIKPHNILLDKDLKPKISDFGLAKLCPNRSSIVSMLGARGTVGYIAPEVFCRNFGQVSHKSDIYSYGMMVLEMVLGRKNIEPQADQSSEMYFPDWIYRHLEQNVETGVDIIFAEEVELQFAKKKLIIIGLWCIQTEPKNRPSISRVIEMLEGKVESLQVPPRPHLSSPPRSIASFSVSSST